MWSSSDDAARAARAARNSKVESLVQGTPELVKSTASVTPEEIIDFANEASCFVVGALSDSGYVDESRLRLFVIGDKPFGLPADDIDPLTSALGRGWSPST